MDCWGRGGGDDEHLETATCAWLQFWVQLDSPAKVAAYKQLPGALLAGAEGAGPLPAAAERAAAQPDGWLDYNKVVPGDVRLQVYLAFGFLLVCLVNTVGLMLAKFMRRAGELGVRRALGASRRAVFAQLLVESGVIGLAGGIGGLLLAAARAVGGAPPAVRLRQAGAAGPGHAARPPSLLALGASLLAGLLPAWRACQVTPALQLKSN